MKLSAEESWVNYLVSGLTFRGPSKLESWHKLLQFQTKRNPTGNREGRFIPPLDVSV